VSSKDSSNRHASLLVLDDVRMITPILRHIHCLPLPERIEFKLSVLVLVHKALNGLSPQYPTDTC